VLADEALRDESAEGRAQYVDLRLTFGVDNACQSVDQSSHRRQRWIHRRHDAELRLECLEQQQVHVGQPRTARRH
jgi:hypothetical protein